MILIDLWSTFRLKKKQITKIKSFKKRKAFKIFLAFLVFSRRSLEDYYSAIFLSQSQTEWSTDVALKNDNVNGKTNKNHDVAQKTCFLAANSVFQMTA